MALDLAVPGAVRHALVDLDRRISTSNRALWFVACLPLLALYLLTARTDPYGMCIDTVSVTSSAWQLAHHASPRLLDSVPNLGAWMIPSGHGYVISNRAPGLVGLAAIFYWLIPGASSFDVAPASIAAAVVTSAAMGTLAVLLRRIATARVALAASLILGTATTTWAVSGTALWPHGPDQLYLVIAMLAVASGCNAWTGLAFALAILTRPPLAVVAVVAGCWASWVRRSPRPALVIGAISGCGLVGFLWYSHVFWDGGLQSQYTEAVAGADPIRQFFDVSPHALEQLLINIAGTLVSPDRGVLFGAPFLLALAPGLRQAWKVAPQWVRSAAASGLVYMFVQLKTNRFSGGSMFWSYRYPLETITLMAPLLLLAWRAYTVCTARRRAAFAGLLLVALVLQTCGAIFRGSYVGAPWGTADLKSVVIEHPVASLTILIAGYLAAALVYRKMAYADGTVPQSLFSRFGSRTQHGVGVRPHSHEARHRGE